MKNFPNTGVDWRLRQGGAVRRFLRLLERVSLAAERPLAALVRDPRWNPLYHTGPITVFLLLVIALSGIYLTLFYPFGFTVSYNAVAAIQAHPLGRIVRALHRYASGAAVIFALLHGWRTFFQDRFRGPRWLAWLTGILMVVVAWLIGLTGYWLIWDTRAQVINQTLAGLIGSAPWGQAFLVDQVILPEGGIGWVFVFIVVTVHIGLSLAVGGMLWLHVRRLARPKWLPPDYWMAAPGLLLLLASVLVPVDLLPPMNSAALPQSLPIDGFYLWNLPLAFSPQPGSAWLGVLALIAALSAFPWLLGSWTRRPLPPVTLLPERCIGCTLCARDCPYNALSMVERGQVGQPKYIAILHPHLCVSCGICVGSCPTNALLLNTFPTPQTGPVGLEMNGNISWQQAVQSCVSRGQSPTLVFTCERHAFQGVQRKDWPADIIVAPLSCIAMAHPDLVGRARALGAEAVRFVGCPPEDCANREGNLWMQQRLEQTRLPRLRVPQAGPWVSSAWLPPDRFDPSPVNGTAPATAYGGTRAILASRWRQWLPALLVLAAILAAQVAFTYLPFQPYAPEQAQLEVLLRHRPGVPIHGQVRDGEQPPPGGLAQLTLLVDGKTAWQQNLSLNQNRSTRKLRFYTPVLLKAGTYQVQLVYSEPGRPSAVLYDGPLTLQPGQIQRLAFEDDITAGDPDAGQALFFAGGSSTQAGCSICHSLNPDERLVGPSLAGIANRAASRVPGLTAEQYLRQSILDPDAYIVPGFPSGQMWHNYKEMFSEQQIQDLVAFLLTLK